MFKQLLLSITLLPGMMWAQTAECTQKCDKSSEYQLVWHDDFEYAGNEIEKKWTVMTDGKGGGNNELQYYLPSNLNTGKEPVSGTQSLIITAQKQKYANNDATSGRLSTEDKVSFQYGKVEARIKLPETANGLWPAFWLLGTDIQTVGWPACGEIDILEMGNNYGIENNIQDKYFNGACHWGQSYNNGAYPFFTMMNTSKYSLQDDFHLYTLYWDSTSIKMYLDQDKFPDVQPYYELNTKTYNTADKAEKYFNKPFFIILNLAVGGNFTRIHDINKVTALQKGAAQMYVDYVKVYQKKNQININKNY